MVLLHQHVDRGQVHGRLGDVTGGDRLAVRLGGLFDHLDLGHRLGGARRDELGGGPDHVQAPGLLPGVFHHAGDVVRVRRVVLAGRGQVAGVSITVLLNAAWFWAKGVTPASFSFDTHGGSTLSSRPWEVSGEP